MENVSLNVGYMSESYIINCFEDMHLIKDHAKSYNLTIPPLIIVSFLGERYSQASGYGGLDDIPDVVANVFLDYANNDCGDDLQVRHFFLCKIQSKRNRAL